MFGRTGFAVMLAGAVGAPYLMSTGVEGLTSGKSNSDPAKHAAAGLAIDPALHPAGADAPSDALVPADDSTPAVAMEEVFRFDHTMAWVLGRWPRVSAGLAELDMQGYRVPLVTGGQTDDLAGSLTYYYNQRQRVQRITFFGRTGDARRLVALLSLRHGFVRELDADPSLFLYRVRENRKVISELRIKPNSVVRADAPFSRFDVALLIERPETLD
jgi:Family of unknown function (DUF6690)